MPEKTVQKQASTRFKPGQSGNPAGRPRGARNKASMLAQKLMENQTEAVVQTVIDAALTGDMQACKLIVERLLPPAKERAIQADLKLPATITTENAPLVFAAILKATASGGLCPGEGETLQRMMQMYLTAVEYTTLTRRIEELEARQDGGQAW
jgi:hypothetical protein